jgi:transcriptional regulatory protein GAL4
MYRYLTGVEKRLVNLENLVTQLLPGINIDDVLSSPDLAKATLPIAGPGESGAVQTTTPSAISRDHQDANSEPLIPEAVPNNADGFNWQEEDVNVDGLTDGMAALSVEPTGVGYLGTIVIHNPTFQC